MLIRNAHPREQNPPSLIIFQRLRRVKVKSSVKLRKFTVLKFWRLCMRPAEEIARLVAVMIFYPFGFKPLRTYEQDVGSVKRKQVGTFPHITE